MKITNISWERYDLRLSKPYTIAYEVIDRASNFVLRLETENGMVGQGCAAPDVPVTGETPAMVEIALKSVIEPFLHGQNPFTYARLLSELRKLLPGQSSALSMVDSALHDLIARRAGVPLYQFMGGYRRRIETSITIGILPLAETMTEAAEFVGQGFRILKIKGGLSVDEDSERMLKLREQFPDILLRFDGNQGYSVSEALEFVRQTNSVGIEIFEQPTLIGQEKKLGRVTEQTSIPVMADESLKSLQDSFRLVSNKRVNMINIKLMKVGGILEGMHINSVAKSDHVEVMVGCIDESALGIAAGLHFALSRPNIRYADLDGHLDFVDDPFAGLCELKDGWLIPNDVPGLGWRE